MRTERIHVPPGDSVITDLGTLVVSGRKVAYGSATLTVGRPGMPNLTTTLGLGEAVLFETPEGTLEIRVLKSTPGFADVLITQLSPRPGLAGGFVDQTSENQAFSEQELKQISESIDRIRLQLQERGDVTSEQMDLISRKLGEMEQAASRMGRRDWMNLAVGTLTTAAVSAALTPEVTKALFRAADIALSWMFSGAVLKVLTP